MAEESTEQLIDKALKDDTEHKCKRCGFDQREEYTPVDDNQLQEYFRAALAQTPFTKTYDLYGGVLVVSFEEATGKLLRLQEHAIIERAKQGNASIADAADFSLISSLTSVVQHPKEGSARIIYQASVEDRISTLEKMELPDVLLNMPIIQLQALRSTYNEFSKLCAALMLVAQDENFWKGAGRN